MGSFANSLFTILLGWLQGAVSAVWNAFTTENGNSFFTWIGKNWLLIAGVLCLTGLAADLCVYLFRWKPYKVWKSFFRRERENEEPEQEEEISFRPAAERTEPALRTERRFRHEPEPREEEPAEPDFSQWELREEEPVQPVRPAEKPAEEPEFVTNAGYVVPADSPYRRPEAREYTRPANEPVYRPGPATDEGRNEDTPPAAGKRRRRISVSDLFADPEEEIQQFDAPQQLFDSSKAYHKPVYPRGWNKSEDDGE